MRLPKITIPAGGDFFLNENGTEFFYAGASEFGLWKRFNMQSGPEALVRPILIERRNIADAAGYKGALVARVFRYSDPGNVFGMLPYDADFSKINNFLDMCAEYNYYVDWTCGDSQKSYVLPGIADQQTYLNDFCKNVDRFCFMETCNEPFKNGQLPQNGVKSPVSLNGMYLRDSGNYVYISDTQQWEYQYDLDFISFHGDRTNDPPRWPKWVCDLDDSLSVLRSHVRKPAVLKEPNKFGAYYTDVSLARLLGLRVNMGGVTFHSQLGLETNGYDEQHKIAFGNYCSGVAAATRV